MTAASTASTPGGERDDVDTFADLPDGLELRRDGAVRILTFTRAEQRNTITGPIHRALADIWRRIERDPGARAVLVRSTGAHFTAGGDFEWFQELQADPHELERSFVDGQQFVDDLVRFSLPVVAAVRGGAVGMGASLAMLADFVVMADDAFYRDPHVSLGLVAGDGGVAAWPYSTSLQIAKEYLLLGDRLTASEAYRLGMVNRVVPSDDVDAVARSIADRLAALPPHAARATKRALNLHLERGMRGIAEFGLAAEKLSHHTPEFKETAARLSRPKT